jgi:hypothetical protein
MARRAKAKAETATENTAANGNAVADSGPGVPFVVTVNAWANNPAGEKARETFGEPFEIQMRRFGDEFTAYFEHGGQQYNSDTPAGAKKKSWNAAVFEALTRVPGIEGNKLKESDIQGEIPDSNVKEAEPWDEGQPNADRIREINEDVNNRLDNLGGLEVAKRDNWLTISSELAEAYKYVASQSETTRASTGIAKADKHRWGRYLDKFFPRLEAMGPNTANEAVNLGSAPEALVKLWPENQTSPKGFTGWENAIRKELAAVIYTVVVDNSGKYQRLIDWVEAGKPEDQREALQIKVADIHAAIDNGDVMEAVQNERLRRIRENEEGKKLTGPKALSKIVLRTNAENELKGRAMPIVAEWRLPDLPRDVSTEEFKKNKFGRQIFDVIEEFYHSEFDKKQTEEEATQAKKKKASEEAKETGKSIADMDPNDAADIIFGTLSATSDPALVLELLKQKLSNSEGENAAAADDAAEEADAAMDGAAK